MAMTSRLPAPPDKAAAVQAMFDRIAPRYDLLNRLLTFRLDRRWRRLALRLIAVGPADVVVDIGCGTGDMCALAAAAGARVIGVDFSGRMLAGARARGVPAAFVRADGTAVPLRAGSASVVTSAFVMRNVVSIPHLLDEAARLLASGGRLALLEVDAPRSSLLRLGHAFYFHRVVPAIGGLISDRDAYRYLPDSTAYLPDERALHAMLAAAGFGAIVKRRLGGGAAQLLLARR
ncbi:ubiquinone/menaquinone biosynthesis methyltransferase [Candidatus Binatia bacterium]|nr:ubiquinone/menaquinone biosynthesis methyltransferase [Candidatus Binatia bacterium]